VVETMIQASRWILNDSSTEIPTYERNHKRIS